MDEREEFAAGLRALAAAIETDPDLPLPDGRIALCVIAREDEAGCAQIDAVATALGVEASWAGDEMARYQTTAKFGPVYYEAFYCSRASMDRYRDRQSYCSNIETVA